MTKLVYNIPSSFGDGISVSKKYYGCGNGWIKVNKDSNQVVEMSYARDGVTICREQNISMCKNAGKVFSEDAQYRVVRANFSCYQACLF